MFNLMYCEIFKLKRAKIIPVTILGALVTPVMIMVEAVRMHFKSPDEVITMNAVFDNSLIYNLLLLGLVVYTVTAAYLFCREYTENTLKTVLSVPVEKVAFITGKLFTLCVWILLLSVVTWLATLVFCIIYAMLFGMEGINVVVAATWLLKSLAGGMLTFGVISPLTYLAQATKGIVVPVIAASVLTLGNAALSNESLGAFFPWTAVYLLIKGTLADTGYPVALSLLIISAVSLLGFAAVYLDFLHSDVK